MASHDGFTLDHERIAHLALTTYLTDLPLRGAKPGIKSNSRIEWTVLAAFVLSFPSPHHPQHEYALISLATGLKCLPYTSLPVNGDVLHDQHAEVLARRGARQWLLQRLEHEVTSGAGGGGLTLFEPVVGGEPRWKLRQGVRLHLYVSTLPCGDASSRLLEFQRAAQDQVSGKAGAVTPAQLLERHTQGVAALSSAASSATTGCSNSNIVRGRASSSHCPSTTSGSLRTKPGRPDSPPSICMSCSDKLALCNAPGIGIQGSLLSSLLEPTHIHSVTLCDHPTRHIFPAFPLSQVQEEQREALKGLLAEECRRALCRGGSEVGLVVGWSTSAFAHSKETQMDVAWSAFLHHPAAQHLDLDEQMLRFKDSEPVTCPNSVVFVANPTLTDTKGKIENLATGTKMGAPTKRPQHPRSQCSQPLKAPARSSLCRLSAFQSFVAAHTAITGRQMPSVLYSDAKEGAFGEGSKAYRRNKAVLLGGKLEAEERVRTFLAGARDGTAIRAAVLPDRVREVVPVEEGQEDADGKATFKSWLRTPDVFSQFDLQGQTAHNTQALDTITSTTTHVDPLEP
ncbi:related to tRNA-specific adenosine deaminase 1 [Sporisorium reilianum f. sp. reilianum]|uniref:Related to tRNA-specific adenosine deaminase 1 n=1 Tax=Sporisorium reilianum f. sp. reilianum TaxID=72559 RepID=A0A2N8UMF2_9BASI|nr:related to tRNA-specific adenosine deaminase 1 [Sporisorium reilianum f. sp. reilianum]